MAPAGESEYMDPEQARVAMLSKDSPHHAHEGFADAVGADIISFPGMSAPFSGTFIEDLRHCLRAAPTDYDVYLAEGTSDLYLAAQLAIRTHAPLVYLCDDHRLFGLNAYRFDSLSPNSAIKRLDRTLDFAVTRRLAARYVDGVVAGSTLTAEYTRPVTTDNVPFAVANPYIHPDAYERLGTVEPSLDANVAVTVGIAREYKGIDRLVDVWPAVRREVSGAELYVVGPGYPETYADVPGVHLTGYVEPVNLGDVLERASVYIHPARVEAFGVTVVEAMRAGLPAIVTETTGARDAVDRIDETYVIPSSKNAISTALCEYFESPLSMRSNHSTRAQAVSEAYTAKNKKSEFENAFETVLNDID